MSFPRVSRGTAKPLDKNSWYMRLDEEGITNLQLHRRTDIKDPGDPLEEIESTDVFPRDEKEVLPRDYKFTVIGNNSYRTVHNYIQNESPSKSQYNSTENP